jgi:hypothetical protein
MIRGSILNNLVITPAALPVLSYLSAQALAEFRQVVEQTLGYEAKPWYFSYRARVGVK